MANALWKSDFGYMPETEAQRQVADPELREKIATHANRYK